MSNQYIYHYTTVSGVFGILNSDHHDKATLRLSNILQMNDKAEYKEGTDLISQRINAFKANDSIKNSELLDRIESIENMYMNGRHGVPNAEDYIYVISFSKIDNDLGQWRGYTKPGNSFCIKFNYKKLHDHITSARGIWILSDCKYCHESKARDIDWIIDPGLSDTPSPLGSLLINDNLSLPTKVKTLLAFMKNEHYTQENEIRLVQPAASLEDISCQVSNENIRAYVHFEIPVDIIEEIQIGPNSDAMIVANSLRLFLKRRNLLDQIHIKYSEIPFRF